MTTNGNSTCVLSGDALVAALGFGSSFAPAASESSGSSSSVGRERLEIVGDAIEPWIYVGHLLIYYAALLCVTYFFIWWKWPVSRKEVFGR